MASVERAGALLREWNISTSRIFCTSVSQGRACSLRGTVVEANQEGFTIANSSDENLVIRFFQVRNFDVQIVRFFQVPKFKIGNTGKGSLVRALRLSLDDGGEITLHEESP